jgi:hypothetical protein
VQVADGRSVPVEGAGNIDITVSSDDIQLNGVLFVSMLRRHLFSVKAFTQAASKNGILFLDNVATLLVATNNLVLHVSLGTSGKFYILATVDPHNANLVQDKISNLELLHYRLGHTLIATIQHLSKSVIGLSPSGDFDDQCCDICSTTKMTRSKFPKPSSSERRTFKKLELINSDVCGPFTPSICGGYIYIILFIDTSTRIARCYLMKKKSKALDCFKQFIADCGTPFQVLLH